ncbi:MAG: hypothetical protein FD138_1941 [Planctomycetota bacterium]|nr:MAG: hypothetical protein FD138_1941 [Planctomycetota bacterium]
MAISSRGSKLNSDKLSPGVLIRSPVSDDQVPSFRQLQRRFLGSGPGWSIRGSHFGIVVGEAINSRGPQCLRIATGSGESSFEEAALRVGIELERNLFPTSSRRLELPADLHMTPHQPHPDVRFWLGEFDFVSGKSG